MTLETSLGNALAADGALGVQVLAKVVRRLIPFLFILFVVAYLDRTNVSFAALKMNRDLGFTRSVYGFGAGVFFIGYALFEVPSNLLLAKVGARRWIARIMVSWGLIAIAMMFVRGTWSFYLLRFLLGVAEAGFFPGIVYYLSSWIPAAARGRTLAGFMTAIPLANIVGLPISGALLDLDGSMGLAGWQWLFLLEGLPAVLLGVAVLFYLPERPADARWLTQAESGWLSERLAAERAQSESRLRLNVLQALTNPIVWQLGLLWFLVTMGGYALLFWLPQILQAAAPGLGNKALGMLAAVPYVFGATAMMLNAAHSDRTGERCLHVAGAMALAAVGYVGLGLATGWLPVLLFLCVAQSGVLGPHGAFWPLPSKFLTGAAAAGGVAMINSLANFSGFVGPWLMGALRDLSGGFHMGLMLMAVVPLAASLIAWRLRQSPVLRAGP